MRWYYASTLALVAACGRFGFESSVDGDAASGSGAVDGSVDAMSTGVAGPRWMRAFGAGGAVSGHDGGGGEVAVVQAFNNTFATDGVSLTGMGYSSSAFIRYDAMGAIERAVALDATGFCEMKDVIVDGEDTIVAGLTIGTSSVPAYGACSIVTNRQDPLALRIAADGTQSVVAHWSSSGANAQAWDAVKLSDGTLVMSGIYGSALTINGPLPNAMLDPNAWIARSDATTPTTGMWAKGLSSSVSVHAGRSDVRDDATCIVGAFDGPTTLLGVALPHVGGYDSWVSHLTSTGAVDYVRAIGSTGSESSYEDSSSIVALPAGSCLIGIDAPGDVTFDSMTFPASQGRGLMIELGATGALVRGMRFPTIPRFTTIGSRTFVAFGVSAPYMVGSQLHTPDGMDVLIVERDIQGQPDQLLGVVGGAGNQEAVDLFDVAPDALGIVVRNTGALVFGSTMIDSGAMDIRAVGVLGL